MTDRRTFKDRRELWAAEKKEKEFVAEKPKAKIKHVEANSENQDQRKPRTKRGEQPTPAEEQPAADEAPAQEEAPAEEQPQQANEE